jgi:plastocyanin
MEVSVRRMLLAFAVLMLIPGAAWAGGGGVDTSGCAGYSEGIEVAMLDSCFEGTAHFAADGEVITVSNDGILPHTFTAVDGTFDTGTVSPGSTAELTVDEPGVYRVFCSLHGTAGGEGMAGVLVVGEAAPAAGAHPSDGSVVPVALSSETRGASPQVLTVRAANVDPVQLVVILVVGLSAGLALAALLIVMRLRVVEHPMGRGTSLPLSGTGPS